MPASVASPANSSDESNPKPAKARDSRSADNWAPPGSSTPMIRTTRITDPLPGRSMATIVPDLNASRMLRGPASITADAGTAGTSAMSSVQSQRLPPVSRYPARDGHGFRCASDGGPSPASRPAARRRRQRHGQVGGFAAGLGAGGAGAGDPNGRCGARERQPAGGGHGDGFDGTGFAAAGPAVAGTLRRDLRPGQGFELCVQGWLVALDLDQQMSATVGDLAGVASLGVQRVGDEQHPGPGCPGRLRWRPTAV